MRAAIGSIVLILGGAYAAQCQPAAPRSYASIFRTGLAAGLTAADTVPLSNSYYFPHLALGTGFQTTLTLVNYSPQQVSCQTTFFSDSGAPLTVPFADQTGTGRSDNLGPGDDVHVETTADVNQPVVTGWAQAQCSGPIKASLLYRLYSNGKPIGEAGVNAMTTPATEFVSFAESHTGVAYANPSATPATITITALSASPGPPLGSTTFVLQPNAHGAANIGPLLGLASFTGSVQITSDVPIVSLALNAEAFPSFSSLPPGDLPAATPLATTTVNGSAVNTPPTNTYYFPHLALGGGFQTTLTYVNYSPQNVSCQTTFFTDSGGALAVSFADQSGTTRTDNLGGGQTVHVQSTANLNAAVVTGWAQAQCTGPIKASLLYRLFSNGAATGEAAVNAMSTPTTEFVTFAQTQTGAAWANPSAQTAIITVMALDATTGLALGTANVMLAPNAHGAANIGSILGLANFTGSVQITSTQPIVSLSLNAEDFPVFSSLPPGDLPASTPLATGH